MATVTSFTAEKIQELLDGYSDVPLTQQEILSLIGQLAISTQATNAQMVEIQQTLLPGFQEALTANSVKVAELGDTILPNLQSDLAQAELDLENINEVDIPSIREDLDAEITNGLDRPHVYVQPEEPTNPDEDGRDLLVGDSWFDEDDNNTQYIWNGVEWSTLSLDIPDLSITVQKFKTSTHMIY